jgi:hypothetical protein
MPEPSPSPVALLRAHSRHAPWNARGLAAHVTALVDAAGIRPTNASARVAPSARSVRFYVANGLLDRPEGAGTAISCSCSRSRFASAKARRSRRSWSI